ncbi:ESPL1 protein, partial [Amia calva]|nr:ESPL1 protein [Amia calva]
MLTPPQGLVRGDGPCTEQRLVCDRVLRACNQQLGAAGGEQMDPGLMGQLVALAELALRGYEAAGAQQAPLYIEKIVFHLLRNLSARGAGGACRTLGALLYSRLVSTAESEDFGVLVRSCFAVLWKSAAGEGGEGDPQARLSGRLQATAFLLLHNGATLSSPQPLPDGGPSLLLRHCEAALMEYEANRGQLCEADATILLKEMDRFLLQPLLQRLRRSQGSRPDEGGLQPLCSWAVLCEIVLQNCKQFSKAGCWGMAATHLEQATAWGRELCPSTHAHTLCPCLSLVLVRHGVSVLQALCAEGDCGQPLTQCARALRALPSSCAPPLGMLGGCQFVAWALEAGLQRPEGRSHTRVLNGPALLAWFSFSEEYQDLLQRRLDSVTLSPSERRLLQQTHFHSLHQGFLAAYDSLLAAQLEEAEVLRRVLLYCRAAAVAMLAKQEALPAPEQEEHFVKAASDVSNLACALYNQKCYSEASALVQLLCEELGRPSCPPLPLDKLQRAFLVAVQSSRKEGQLDQALGWVVRWLRALRDQVIQHMVEPVSLWVKTKGDAARAGLEETQLRTLKDGFEGKEPAEEVLLALLQEELSAYRSVAGDTAQERYNTLCDLLDICHEGSAHTHLRAALLCQLAQLLCYNNLALHTDCSALDSIQEALRLLELEPEMAENQACLQDDRAHASLWLYICTLERNLQEAVQMEQRVRAAEERGQMALDDETPNDLDYEERQQDSQLVYNGLRLSLVADSKQSQPLDRALGLWRELLSGGGLPAVRSVQQTATSLHLTAALYRLMGKSLQALESYSLAARLTGAIGEGRSPATALCHSAKLLLEMGAPTLAQPQLEAAEACLSSDDLGSEGLSLLRLLCALLRSQLCCDTGQVEEGVSHLAQVLQKLAGQKQTKSWCLLRASVMQTVGTYLSLPTSVLPPSQRLQITQHGWRSPDAALSESRKLLCSVVVSLMGNGLIGNTKTIVNTRFVDQGENVLQKWQVLAEVVGCSRRLVLVYSQVGAACEARAVCLEALRLTAKLQTLRHWAEFLLLKAELELQRGERELSGLDLQHVRELLEQGIDPSSCAERRPGVKIQPKKGRTLKKHEPVAPSANQHAMQEEGEFLSSRVAFPREVIDTVQEWNLTSSPPLRRTAPRWLSALAHHHNCVCPCCSDPSLARVCVHWAAARAELDSPVGLVSGEQGAGRESRKLFLLGLSRCRALSAQLGMALAQLGFGSAAPGKPAPSLGFLQDLVGRIYLRLACSSLDTPPAQKPSATWELLDAGLSALAQATAPELLPLRAGLLATKALALIYALAAQRDRHLVELFSPSWAWNPPPREKLDKQEEEGVGGKLKPKTPQHLATQPAARKVREGGSRPTPAKAKLKKPVSSAKTPVIKQTVLKARVPFQVYEETSPPADTHPAVPAAPKRNTRSRFKVVFSDESDVEEADNVPVEQPSTGGSRKSRPGRATSTTKPLQGPKKPGRKRVGKTSLTTALPPAVFSPSTEEDSFAQPSSAPCRDQTRKVARSSAALVTRRGVRAAQQPEPELMRTIEEEEEEGDLGLDTTGRRPSHPQRSIPDGECEVLRRDQGMEVRHETLAETRRGLHPNAPLPSALHPSTGPEGLSLQCVQTVLQTVLVSLQHCPPTTLYTRVCHLLSLCQGDALPLLTALLHSESLAVSARHTMARHLHSRLRRLRKASGPDLAERLQELSLGDPAPTTNEPSLQLLTQLEQIFQFPALEPGSFPQSHCQVFQEQLGSIPPGVTVCLLSVVSLLPGEVGDTVLLTRLERDAPPITVRIPTAHGPVTWLSLSNPPPQKPISVLLQEFEAVQQQQKVISNVTDKVEWWEGRRRLDTRMKVLLEAMEEQVLGCWRGLLLPCSQDPEVAKQAAHVSRSLSECGTQDCEDLLKVVLSASALLSRADLLSLAGGLCPKWPDTAQHLLQTAVSMLRDRADVQTDQQIEGHLVLMLDKYLQKLPWECVPSLRTRHVTRLPCLHFLLGHCILRELDPGSVLRQGVDPQRAFYVLNPQANLPSTEERFRDWFTSEEGWQGVCGTAPTSDQVQEALATKDLYIYAGHGAGARFLDGAGVLRGGLRAVSLLLGCSSAALAVRGELEGAGIVINYLMAGCPLVLGNLWDVTDRDIDRFMAALLQGWLKGGHGGALLTHLASSRQAPRLKHLIGAAPVVYGLPVTLR